MSHIRNKGKEITKLLKRRTDFKTEKEYMQYTKTSDFLLNYNWEGKSKKQIINEMALPDFEQIYLDEAIEHLTKQKDFTGMALDRFILQRLDEEEIPDEFNPDDVIFIDRKE